MEKNIDDLLKNVDGKLIANYESKHLNGVTLKLLNEEYATVKEDPDVILTKAVKLLLLCIAISGLWLFASLLLEIPWYIGYSPIVLLVIPVCFYMTVPLKNRINMVARCEPTLRDFRKAVAGLNPLGLPVQKYTETSVKNTLVYLAESILDAEDKFTAVCTKEKRQVDDILLLGNFLKRRQSDFLETLDHAKKFGLKFKSSDLFSDADLSKMI